MEKKKIQAGRALKLMLPCMLLVCAGMAGRETGSAGLGGEMPHPQEAAPPAQSEPALVIESDSPLPDTFPHEIYEYRFLAHGGVPTLHWKVQKGAIPFGMRLEDNGLLHGRPERAGEFEFTVSVRDGGQPQQAVQKGFILRVKSALTIVWSTPAHVTGSKVEGSVAVSNTTPDDMELTFVVMAVAGNGRATAIGYQHLLLKRGTQGMELPFGETMPHGSYTVHVDAVGEVIPKNLIYRDRLQMAVNVVAGP
jgi:hypothetical protein